MLLMTWRALSISPYLLQRQPHLVAAAVLLGPFFVQHAERGFVAHECLVGFHGGLVVAAQVEIESEVQKRKITCLPQAREPGAVMPGSTRGQPGINPGSTVVNPGPNGGQGGVKVGSRWGQGGV